MASESDAGTVAFVSVERSRYHCTRGRARIGLPLDRLSNAMAADTWCLNSSLEMSELVGNRSIFANRCLPAEESLMDSALVISDLRPASPSFSSDSSKRAFRPSAPAQQTC